MSAFYITTPIYYVNGTPHIGHAYTSILADMLTRFHALEGEKTFFLTGTDEHGDKIVRTAEKAGIAPKELADSNSAEFKKLWTKLDISYSNFVRTTDEQHKNVVQGVLQQIYDKGDIYFGEYGGHYCYGCERFYTEKELENGLCSQHQTAPEYIIEKNYFFKLTKYKEWLLSYIHEHPEFIQPVQYRNEVLGMLEKGELEDLCISRPKTRLTWGITLPFDTEYVCYVWFDALLNYLSGIGYPDSQDFSTFWPANHIIAKDIVKPHAIFWPCMLHSAGIPLFKTLYVHGYWVSRNTKLSKSLGNAIDPSLLIQQYGVDAVRYFLLRDMHFGSDANFTETIFVDRIISDLANDIGNLFSRTLGMAHKYVHSVVPSPADRYTEEDMLLIQTIKSNVELYKSYCTSVSPSRAIEAILTIASTMNKYIDEQAPWKLYKENNTQKLDTVLYCLLEGLRKIALMLMPIMPSTAKTMLALLGTQPDALSLKNEERIWGLLVVGETIASSANLFPRDTWEETKKIAEEQHNKCEMALEVQSSEPVLKQEETIISYENFTAVDIRIGTIIHAERIPKADKLLRLEVNVGETSPRQVLAGIAEYYTPEQLLQKQVMVVMNLAPRTMRGLESHGMILAIKTEEGLTLPIPETMVIPGSKIS